jgi:hypothetical protein
MFMSVLVNLNHYEVSITVYDKVWAILQATIVHDSFVMNVGYTIVIQQLFDSKFFCSLTFGFVRITIRAKVIVSCLDMEQTTRVASFIDNINHIIHLVLCTENTLALTFVIEIWSEIASIKLASFIDNINHFIQFVLGTINTPFETIAIERWYFFAPARLASFIDNINHIVQFVLCTI